MDAGDEKTMAKIPMMAERTLRWLSGELRTQMVQRLGRYTASRTDAEDAYQIALTALAARRSVGGPRRLEGERTASLRHARLVSYLYVIAKRYLISRYRREVRFPHAALEPLADRVPAPSAGADVYLDGYLVRQALLTLSPEDRDLLTRKAVGASCDELAQRLGITPAAVEKRLQRARERFRQRMIALGCEDPLRDPRFGPLRARQPGGPRPLS